MKKILIILSYILLYSCEKQLEIVPDYKFPAELATSNLDSLEKITNGTFNQLQSSNLFGGGLIANSELLADNWHTNPISNFSLNQLRTRQMNAYNGEASGLWNDGYRAINMANIVLNHLPEHQEQDIEKAILLEGECLFIRAICHFEILRMFSQAAGFTNDNSHLGIPIRISIGSATEEQNTPRASVEQVYNQIIDDLEKSILLLPENKNERVSKWAAMAYLCKVYFQKNDFQNALYWCDAIIESNQFSLNTNIDEIYSLSGWNYSNESIFQMINIPQDMSNGTLTGRLKSNSVDYHTPFNNLIETTLDDRKTNLYTFLGIPYLRKYSNTAMNITVIRLAEIYLNRAECKVHLGYSDTEVRDDYNIIRLRANNVVDSISSGAENLLSAIHTERWIELGFEGDRYHDLKRRKEKFNTFIGEFSWDDPRLVYPIPQQEMDQNSNMVQNQGY